MFKNKGFYIVLILIFLYFFSVFDINFHGPDEPIYLAYTTSIFEDLDLNIVNNQNPLYFTQLVVSPNYNLPDFHNHGGVVLWLPFYAYAKFIHFVSSKLSLGTLEHYSSGMMVKLLLSFSTVVFGVLVLIFSYLFSRLFISRKIAFLSTLAICLGTPFFYYMLFQVGNANMVAALFSAIIILFFSRSLNFKRRDWLLFGLLFSIAVTVKTEIWFQLVFIVPLFLVLLYLKRVNWFSLISFLFGFMPILILRALNAYIKYGTVHMEEVIYFESIFSYSNSYNFNGIFDQFRGILYTSPVLILSFLGFILLLIRLFKKLQKHELDKVFIDIFAVFISFYAVLKIVIIGRIFSPAGGEMTARILMTELPIFIFLFGYLFSNLKSFTKVITAFFSLAAIFWNLLIIAGHCTGLEWLYLSEAPTLLERIVNLVDVLPFLFGVYKFKIKLLIFIPLVAIMLIVFLYKRNFLKYLTVGKINLFSFKLIKFFIFYSGIVYFLITILNFIYNKSNVEKMQSENYFVNAEIINIQAFKMSAIEKEQHLHGLIKMMHYYGYKDNVKRLIATNKHKKFFYPNDQGKYSFLMPYPDKAYYSLAEIYQERSLLTKAIDCYKKGLAIYPNDVDMLNILGDIYFVNGQYNEAIGVYKKAFSVKPKSFILCRRLADSYNALDVFDEAIKYYLKSIDLNRYNFEAYKELADIYAYKGDYKEAIGYYLKALEVSPNSVDIYGSIADAYDKLGDYKQSIVYKEKAVIIRPESAQLYSSLGDSYMQSGDYERAEDNFKIAIAKKNPNKDVYRNLADIYAYKGDYKEAIGYFKKYIELQPSMAKGYKELADIYAYKGDYKEAIGYYLKALEVSPNSVDIYGSIADAYDKLGDYKQSIVYKEKAVIIRPESAQLYSSLGDSYMQSGDYERAVLNLKKAIKIMPEEVDLYFNIACVYNVSNNYEQAIKYYLKSIEIDSGFVNAYIDLASIYYDLNNYEKAIEYFKKYIKLQPNNPNAYYSLGDAFIRIGDKDNALKQAKELKKLGRGDLMEDLNQEIEQHFEN